jgi:hypothetical protein
VLFVFCHFDSIIFVGVVGFLGFYAFSIKVIFCYSSEVIGPLAFIYDTMIGHDV